MPYEVTINGAPVPLHDGSAVADIAHDRVLRLYRSADDALVVLVGVAAATRDGLPVIGQLTVVESGTSALIRVGRVKAEILWRGSLTRRVVRPGQRCRVCLGGFAARETAAACNCQAVFHLDCERVRISCPGCGAAGEGNHQ